MGARKDAQNRTPVTKVAQQRFLAAYRNSANIRAACDMAGVGRRTFYDWRDSDPEFAALLGDAGEDAVESLEAAGWLRARKTSDSLMKFFLEAHRPEKYGRTIKIDWRNITDDQLKVLAGLAEAGGAEGSAAAGALLDGGEPGEPDALSD